jgi:hypothetical protein
MSKLIEEKMLAEQAVPREQLREALHRDCEI